MSRFISSGNECGFWQRIVKGLPGSVATDLNLPVLETIIKQLLNVFAEPSTWWNTLFATKYHARIPDYNNSMVIFSLNLKFSKPYI